MTVVTRVCNSHAVMYRVVENPSHVVPVAMTFPCGGCHGTGEKGDRSCGWCEGYGRLLRGPDGSEHVWPIPVMRASGSLEGADMVTPQNTGHHPSDDVGGDV